jgi:hypothetical protein
MLCSEILQIDDWELTGSAQVVVRVLGRVCVCASDLGSHGDSHIMPQRAVPVGHVVI